MPRRKLHFIFCKKGLHRLSCLYESRSIKNSTNYKKQLRRVGDRGKTYVARRCEECFKVALREQNRRARELRRIKTVSLLTQSGKSLKIKQKKSL